MYLYGTEVERYSDLGIIGTLSVDLRGLTTHAETNTKSNITRLCS